MSFNVTDPKDPASGTDSHQVASPEAKGKGKGKSKAPADEDMEDDEEEEEEEDEDTDEEEEEEGLEEIDPSAIVGRRTRGVKVDYTSKEALAKAGLGDNEKDEESDDDVEMKD